MLIRTHVMFAIFLVLIFFQHVSNRFLFLIMVLVGTVVPDLDTNRSSYGRHLIFRPMQFFMKHRGVLHSFTTAALLSLLIAVFFPVASFGFFLGYVGHLIIDSFTPDGIRPFWPLKYGSVGPVRTGGRLEETLFFVMVFVDILVFIGFYML